jgi:proline dehydrogenase
MAIKAPFVLASRFVAGETLEAARPATEEILASGRFVTLDLLGEHVHDRERAAAFTDAYVDLLRRMAELRTAGKRQANISIKLSMIGQVIDPDFCAANLRRLLDEAQARDVFVRLDMEGSDITQSTLDHFEAVYPKYPDHVGVVLQAMLKRTEQDVARMCELNARVRLCKGAYKESADVAYQDMPTIRKQYVNLMAELLQHARYPGIATHDDLLIDACKRFVADHGIGREAFEFQMLYGIRPATQAQIVDEGYNLRVYVPYGTEWLPYFSRRLRERKENVWFVLSNMFRR